jgi:hypothetical protein
MFEFDGKVIDPIVPDNKEGMIEKAAFKHLIEAHTQRRLMGDRLYLCGVVIFVSLVALGSGEIEPLLAGALIFYSAAALTIRYFFYRIAVRDGWNAVETFKALGEEFHEDTKSPSK